MNSEDKQFFKSTLIVAFCSFLSRILGLLRSTLLSSFYGATKSTGLTDCYAASFKLPDIIYNLVVFGIISIVLIPYFSGLIKKKEYEKLINTTSSFLNFFFIVILFFIALVYFFTPEIVRNFLVKGWTNQANILLTVKMTRILFLQMLFMTLSGILSSYLNAKERFKSYSIALLSYNVGIIFGILFFTPFMGIEGVAWGAVLGSFMQLFIQVIGAIKNDYKYSFVLPKFTREIKELFVVAVPRIIALGGEQFVKFAIVNIASYLFVGSIFIFENAENFSMVPFGMIAVSISTTAFPIFSKLFVENDFNKLTNSLIDKLRNCLFFILPITVIMMIFSREIIELLLAYKKFSSHDADLTANALVYYMIGIPFFSVTIILVKFYYAQKKSFIPMVVSLIAIVLTIIFSYFLSIKFQITGLSMARSIGYISQTILLIFFVAIIYSKENIKIKLDVKNIINIFKMIMVSMIIFIIGLLINDKFKFAGNVKLDAILKIVTIGGTLSAAYFSILYLLKVPEARNIGALLARFKPDKKE